eukprot:TRINITY_DN122381_c0_g1_i1.p1 TRINITY_DN122381_c0_g1~~TRINITY_DN122381_c0_g1_i1.p1  ORF type:complete len:394 (+),score=131.57 TRINITY_DN122381_c0_g1_i1:79-1260(+)
MPTFGAVMPKDIIAKVAANDSSVTKIDLTGNASFQMKSGEYCDSLAQAMAKNTHVTEMVLTKCAITDADAVLLSKMLSANRSLTTLNLEGNKIGSDGAIAIAEELKTNETLTDLLLLGQDKQAFGEKCLEAWLVTLETNVTIQNIKWRLDSRKSFALNSFLTRNKDIARRKRDGREYTSLLPGSKAGGAEAPVKETLPEAKAGGYEATPAPAAEAPPKVEEKAPEPEPAAKALEPPTETVAADPAPAADSAPAAAAEEGSGGGAAFEMSPFLETKAPCGTTWAEYLRTDSSRVDGATGFLLGPWGECVAWAVVFEHSNDWAAMSEYAADGPVGGVMKSLSTAGLGDAVLKAAQKLEGCCHDFAKDGLPLPVIGHKIEASAAEASNVAAEGEES